MSGYTPIEDYGAIGNLDTVALINRGGSMDWCCLPYLDSPSVFAALLDYERGGRFSVRAKDTRRVDQSYLRHTNVLETTFYTDRGKLILTDFMPLKGSLEGSEQIETETAVYRLLRVEGEAVVVEVEWSPRFDYGRGKTTIERTEDGWLAVCGNDALGLSTPLRKFDIKQQRTGPAAQAAVELGPGEHSYLVTRWGESGAECNLDLVHEKLQQTVEAWHGWVHKEESSGDRSWAGDYGEQVIRSELALKLLTQSKTGAIAAAATTSLPEEIGGVRNWDYRYSWIRDAALSAQALYALGHRQDGHAFIYWAEDSAARKGKQEGRLRVLYGLRGEPGEEQDLPNLQGWRRSSPVRIGNEAADQAQHDIYGELISAAYEVLRLGDTLEPEICQLLPQLADQACQVWQEPDYGIWEVRGGPFHFVYSKAMVWMALDRAIRLAKLGTIEGNVDKWAQCRDCVKEEVLSRGFDSEKGIFKQAYDRSYVDASNLLLPLLEIVPFSDPRVQSNLDRTLEGLCENNLVYRYTADDGIAGHEGAFVFCTFWMVDVLALSDRVDEAHQFFEGLLERRNHLGLYSEQIDPKNGEFLGNFPQAFSHIGLINSALYLAYKEGRKLPIDGLIGTEEHRK